MLADIGSWFMCVDEQIHYVSTPNRSRNSRNYPADIFGNMYTGFGNWAYIWRI